MLNRTKRLFFLSLNKKSSFTLIELLIVIAILSLLAVGGIGQYYNSLKSGRDVRRKSDLQSIQKALETYYQDMGSYPAGTIPDPFCHPSGCATAQYMQKLPTDPGGDAYVYDSDGTYYKLYACIENPNDGGPGVNQDGYGQICGVGRCSQCRYGVSSTNTLP